MSTEPELTEQQALDLINELLGSGAQVALHPFEYGWLAREVLPEETEDQAPNGEDCHIIDRTGVVTAHPGLPIPAVIAEYTRARRAGRTTGRQVWPLPD